MAINKTTLAYLAGIIDADGFIGITKRLPGANRMRSPKYSERLGVAMCDTQALELFQSVFQIHTRLGVRRGKLATHRPCYVFSVENDKAAEIARAVLPFLRVKKKQALRILDFNQLRHQSRQYRTKILEGYTWQGGPNKGIKHRLLGLSDEYLGQCERLYQEARKFNARGPRKGDRR